MDGLAWRATSGIPSVSSQKPLGGDGRWCRASKNIVLSAFLPSIYEYWRERGSHVLVSSFHSKTLHSSDADTQTSFAILEQTTAACWGSLAVIDR